MPLGHALGKRPLGTRQRLNVTASDTWDFGAYGTTTRAHIKGRPKDVIINGRADTRWDTLRDYPA